VTQRFLLILLLATTTVSAENTLPNGKEILAKMAQAMHSLNYQGTVAFLRNGKLEPMKYFHATQNGLEQERMLSLNSPLREIIRDSGKVSCLFKATQHKLIDNRPFEHSFLLDLPPNLDELEALYSIQVVNQENIAMLPTYVLELKSKDQFRYSRKLWVEKNQSLLLKAEVFDLSGKVLEELVFTELEIKDQLAFVDNNTSEAKRASVTNTTQTNFNAAAFTVNQMPQGFHELFFTRRTMHNVEQPVDHLILGDGLSSVSVYLEHRDNNPPVKGQENAVQTIGTINFYSQSIGTYELTVMGEVPEQTIKLIAEGIKLKTSQP
jgi:sigma-E factor negative regulatory protein RseB